MSVSSFPANIIHATNLRYIYTYGGMGHVARMEEGRGMHKVLEGKPEGKRPLGRPRRRWEDNIKMDLQEVGRGLGTGWSWHRIGTGGGRL